ncbi:MAG: hypothetical protein NTU59_10545, partial [Coprothermobacterota bacterium]|nr:hypothetical protein [Coprothermobacterota bacterium]
GYKALKERNFQSLAKTYTVIVSVIALLPLPFSHRFPLLIPLQIFQDDRGGWTLRSSFVTLCPPPSLSPWCRLLLSF